MYGYLIEYFASNNTFKFGSEKRFPSLYKVKIPAQIGSKPVLIITDVVETSVPLLLSKEALKKANSHIDFVDDTVTFMNEKINLINTKSGYYAVPLNGSRVILSGMEMKGNIKLNLVSENGTSLEEKKVVAKLHSQFGHPTNKKLIDLLKRAGWEMNQDTKRIINQVREECQICVEYKRC